MNLPTKYRLAAELRKAADAAPRKEAVHYLALAKRAETGEFDDYGDHHICGPTALHNVLRNNGLHDFAKRVASGEFDATLDESEEWARKQTDPELIALMDQLGLGPDRSEDQ